MFVSKKYDRQTHVVSSTIKTDRHVITVETVVKHYSSNPNPILMEI
jgi:hypothetical protein